MKILTWNCQGSYRTKSAEIAKLSPDLAVIQECESPQRLQTSPSFHLPPSHLWIGDNPHKGLAVFSYTDLTFTLYEGFDDTIKYCLPVRVSGGASFNLIAVWAMPHPDPEQSYVGRVYQAVTRYIDFIRERETVLAGDWNSNKIFDSHRRIATHSAVVSLLAQESIVSVYHAFLGQNQGEESQPTFYLFRREKYTFHLDYCFLPQSWLPAVKTFEVGPYSTWKSLSDHCPLYVEIGN